MAAISMVVVFCMPFNPATKTFDLSDEMERLLREKQSAVELQERRHEDWDDNYELYRNKVKTNRLTQRQAVNIPLMKETVKTLLSRIDEPPEVEWKELGSDEQKELYYQEIWNTFSRSSNLEMIDVMDKKNVLLYGISAKKFNIDEKGVAVDVLDIYDIVLDPLMTPWNLESARFVIHQNIFRSVKEILADDRYTQKGKEEIKIWSDSPEGVIHSNLSREEWEAKMERLRSMGVNHDEFNNFAGGDTIVNLTEHYTRVWNKEDGKWEKRVVVYADNKIELMNEKLEDLIGVDFWPFVVWGEDREITDIYPDSIADLIRTPNKVLNVWFSQLIENRTLKNFQMHWFLPGQNYQAQTYTPGPGVMLPAPPGDDINKVIKPVEVSGLDDTLDAINIVTQIVERATGATAIEKGQGERGTQTLGEIEILVGKAGERVIGMAKFYRLAWYEFAWKWDTLMHANPPREITLFKKGRSGKAYLKKVLQAAWKSSDGYEPIVRSSSEQEIEGTKTIQKFLFILNQFPNNISLRKIAQKRMLELVDLTPTELQEVSDEEEQQQNLLQQSEQPQQNQEGILADEIQNQVNQLTQV